MPNHTTHPMTPSGPVEALRNWIMVVLTLLFVGLYAAALLGWLKPLTDDRMVGRLEPIIFAIIGYYFGRLPGQQNEQTLKQEINRQTQRADAAQSAKEQAFQTSGGLEEKMKNVRATLSADVPAEAASASPFTMAANIAGEDGLTHVVKAAVRILDS